jgi:hypothetical protein
LFGDLLRQFGLQAATDVDGSELVALEIAVGGELLRLARG